MAYSCILINTNNACPPARGRNASCPDPLAFLPPLFIRLSDPPHPPSATATRTYPPTHTPQAPLLSRIRWRWPQRPPLTLPRLQPVGLWYRVRIRDPQVRVPRVLAAAAPRCTDCGQPDLGPRRGGGHEHGGGGGRAGAVEQAAATSAADV